MTNRENFVSLGRRKGYEYMPISLSMSPIVLEKYQAYLQEHDLNLPVKEGSLKDLPYTCQSEEFFLKNIYKNKNFKPGTRIDKWGVAHEPGSEAAYHMTYMHLFFSP